MATTIFIIIVCLLILVGVIMWCVADWKAIDKYNQQFYENGYHIYYDRKIIRELEAKSFPTKNPSSKN